MPEPLVFCNTSPLLYLNLIGYLDILPALYGTIVIPTAVRAELLAGERQGARVPDVDKLPWIQIISLKERTFIPQVADLGPGEAELIALGRQYPDSRLILDDTLGRRIAAENNLTVTGTVGVVIKAKNSGFIEAVKPVVAALRQAGLWLSDDLIQEVLQRAGEG